MTITCAANDYIIYSYGNDYSIIQENLILNDKPIYKYYNWQTKFFDIKPYFLYNKIPVKKYTSGTIYKHFNIKPDSNMISVHNSLWDTYSLFLTISYILKFPKQTPTFIH